MLVEMFPFYKVIRPKILYYGMPVILLNTLNEDGTVNISSMFLVLGSGRFDCLRNRSRFEGARECAAASRMCHQCPWPGAVGACREAGSLYGTEPCPISDSTLPFAVVETQAVHVHAHEEIIVGEHHINPKQWSPLIYNFRHYFGLGRALGKTSKSET